MARITEIKTVCVHSGNYCRPVCLKWLNTLGSWDVWVFEYNQEKGLAVQSPSLYRPTFQDLSLQEGIVETLSKTANHTWTLFSENIIGENLDGFKDLLISPKVYRVVPINDSSWKQYVVQDQTGSFRMYETKNNQFNISLRIREGEIYSQIQ